MIADRNARCSAIGGKDHNRIFPQAQLIQFAEQAADLIIEAVDLSQIIPHALVDISSDFDAIVELAIHLPSEQETVHRTVGKAHEC